MRVLVSAGWLGGAGGAERALHSVIRALATDDVDVVVRQRLGGALAQVGSQVRVISMSDPRFRAAALATGVKGAAVRAVVNPVRRRLLGGYDAYLQFHAGPNLGPTIEATVRLLIPSGNPVDRARAAGFHFVALQAPDNSRLVAEGIPTVLLPPPVFDLSDSSEQPHLELPESYFLTVFNPYGPIKGVEDLARIVDGVPRPIVWCHSQQTVSFEIPKFLRDHPNIIHVNDAHAGQLRYLYENCAAYLSFSLSEGFGWSTADALRYSRAVASRRIGVLSFPIGWQGGVTEVQDPWHVDWSALLDGAQTHSRDLAWLDPATFRAHLLRMSRA